ncbi:uncharacterized protein PgNI_02503 [Pyricularia grisea]|uniref:Secreted protein n=1 Tax=Pyricularia grisea TaxID=148305 RepID=A0A6P8BIY9_PYRGI|nr:uncharacterized protein PgNI_02503 [Pyricularia grisea]TLD16680.1 hypothetical protein PgNI_02503 [Pyricularia grisea]
MLVFSMVGFGPLGLVAVLFEIATFEPRGSLKGDTTTLQEPLRNIDARRGSFRLFCCVRYCSIGVGFWGRAVACVRCLDKGTGSKCSNWQAI